MAVDPDPDGARVWRALADPGRRKILDLLRARPRTTGDIAARFPISRIAVMRHLRVLSSAGLVTNRKRGRERWHYLSAVPLRQMYERWVEAQAEPWASGLLRLRRELEGAGRVISGDRPVVDIALDVAIAAPADEVYAALTKDPGGWWGHPYVRQDATGLELEPRLGGHLVETWSDGGALLASVTALTADRNLALTGPFHLGLALGIADFELTPDGDGTALRFSFRAVGVIDTATVERFGAGWTELIGRLKTMVESGTRLGISPNPPTQEATT